MRRHLAHSLAIVLSSAAIGACLAFVVTGAPVPSVTPSVTIATVLCLGVLLLVSIALAMDTRSIEDDAVSSTQRAMHDLYEDHRPPVPEERTR